MNKLPELLKLPESRKLEFKENLPSNSDLAKTIIAFANDAGGELYLGIKDNPRTVTGLKEDELFSTEEKISSIIHDNCKPVIVPEISFLKYEGKHIIKVLIYKGSNPPYHLKNKSVNEGTFIRVGSTNRLADKEIIAELERYKQNVSFDSELVNLKTTDQIELKTLKALYFEKTGEKLTPAAIKKLDLSGDDRGKNLPSKALILLSDDDLRKKLFPYAKIECARFKGTVPGNFIDQKSIEESICIQPDEAYKFVLRHISEGSTDYTGVYRNDRWEYPVIAIREVIRNAVIHRDYSITGSDIKIAIFDDKIEITSPGLLPPTVDFNDMESGQSRIRNKVLAPLFKRLGIIEQWGNGLQLISDELKKYPEIGFEWKEPGMFFRITFNKKDFKQQQEQQQELQHEMQHELQHELQYELQHELEKPSLYSKVLLLVQEKSLSMRGVSEELQQKNISGQLKKIVAKLLKDGLIEWTIPDSPNSSKQRHRITPKGVGFLKLINKI